MRYAVILVAGLLALAPLPCAAQTATLAREHDPVVLTGADLPALLGQGVGAIVGFRWSGGWIAVPVQVDERKYVDYGIVYNLDPVGVGTIAYCDPTTYTGPDTDPAFDADDEFVFMAADAGDRVPAGAAAPPGTLPGGGLEIRLDDPLDGGSAWLYLFVTDGSLPQDAGQDYVAYTFHLLAGSYIPNYNTQQGPNPEDSIVETAHYRLHFSDRWIRDEIRIFTGSASGADILDRHKNLYAPGSCSRTEETFSNGEGAFFANKDGPVRALRSYMGANSGPLTQRVHRFYGQRHDISTHLRVHPIAGIADFYDYTPEASGMTYHNDLHPAGVVIDGVPETLSPGSLVWEMVTGAPGSLVSSHRFETDIAGFTWTSYYSDDTTPSATQCTGDPFEYGTSGPWIDDVLPNTDPLLGTFKILTGIRIVTFDAPGLDPGEASLRSDRARNPVAIAIAPWLPPEVTILLAPHATTVQAGGILQYDVTVTNHAASARTVTVWIDAFKPSGVPWVGNPIVGPKTKTLGPGQSGMRTLGLHVPAGVPPSGPYTILGSVGTYPNDPLHASSFAFWVVE